MRFRKRWLAKINIVFTNRITSLFARRLPGFGILTHVGRKSGKLYRTPVDVFRACNGFVIVLTYRSQSEWVKNVLAAGGCELKTRGKSYDLSAPRVVRDPPVAAISDSRAACAEDRRGGRVHRACGSLVGVLHTASC